MPAGQVPSNGEVTLRGGIVVRSELHNSHRRDDMREALRPRATGDYTSRYSEGGQNDQLLRQYAQLAAHSDVKRTGAVVREDSKPASAVTSLKLSLHRSSVLAARHLRTPLRFSPNTFGCSLLGQTPTDFWCVSDVKTTRDGRATPLTVSQKKHSNKNVLN